VSKKPSRRRRQQRRDRKIPPVGQVRAYTGTGGEPMYAAPRAKRRVGLREFENVTMHFVEVAVGRCGFTRGDGSRCRKHIGMVTQVNVHDRATGEPKGWQVGWYPEGLPDPVPFYSSWDWKATPPISLEGFCEDHGVRHGDPQMALDVVAKRTTGGDPAPFWLVDDPPSPPHQPLEWHPTT
jgi:hypothetical protein